IEGLNGMFGLAIWDRRREELFLARDRMGEKPLCYTIAGSTLVFASELRALLAHPAVTPRLDGPSLARYPAFRHGPRPHTILQGVHKLPPGHILCARDGGTELRSYWNIPYSPDARIDEPPLLEEIALRFDRSVALRLVSDVPVGCFVSGGIDSTVVTGTAARQPSPLRTFSLGYDDSRHDERPWARIVARPFGTR